MILEEDPKEIGSTIRLIRDKDGNVIDVVHSTENGTSSLFVIVK